MENLVPASILINSIIFFLSRYLDLNINLNINLNPNLNLVLAESCANLR